MSDEREQIEREVVAKIVAWLRAQGITEDEFDSDKGWWVNSNGAK